MDLMKLSGNLESPRQCKASDFPGVGPTGPKGEAKGAGELVKQTKEQASPQDAKDWKIGKSSAGTGSAVKVSVSVDLESGKHSC
jgi:hypothetical protein